MKKDKDWITFCGVYKPNYEMDKVINVNWAIE